MNFLGSALTTIKPRKDDTLIDRLNYYYTSMIIIGLSVTLTAKQYVGQPIQCWVPPEFSHAWEQYAENYCFVYNTYWVKPDEQIPLNRQLFYYQWVPFLMALEAGFFYFPVFFWSKTNRKSGINIKLMIEQKESVQECGSESSERLKAVHKVSEHIEDAFKLLQLRKRKNNRKIIGKNIFKMGIYDGTYLTNMYLITRILYILNIIGQIRIMNHFLGQNDLFWGAHILSDVIRGRNWELSGIFPRVALCDFTIRTLSNIQRYSIQCVLMLNMFNEKIFLFLYWWLIFVGVLTTIDTFKWILNTRMSNRRIIYFRKFISSVTKEEEHLFNEFSNKMIGADGTMLLIMLSTNGGELFIQQILNILWLNYLKYSQLRQVMFSSQKENASINNSFESIEQLSHKN